MMFMLTNDGAQNFSNILIWMFAVMIDFSVEQDHKLDSDRKINSMRATVEYL